jgi:hypothetical protein
MRFFSTRREANLYLKEQLRKGKRQSVYDLKKTHPRRRKTRFLVGDHFDWLSI